MSTAGATAKASHFLGALRVCLAKDRFSFLCIGAVENTQEWIRTFSRASWSIAEKSSALQVHATMQAATTELLSPPIAMCMRDFCRALRRWRLFPNSAREGIGVVIFAERAIWPAFYDVSCESKIAF
jgi:hypothetical protein